MQINEYLSRNITGSKYSGDEDIPRTGTNYSRTHSCLVVLPVEDLRSVATPSSRISSVVSRRLAQESGGGRMSST